jgi:predicted GIY-YIG superfamily endonuclease
MIIVHPTLKKDMQCVYIVRFTNGYFYIGSSIDFRRRVAGYKKGFITGVNISKKLYDQSFENKEAIFSILEEVKDASDIKSIEQSYIRYNCFDKMLLNSKRFNI